MVEKKIKRFTYGDQFTPDKTPLVELLRLCVENEGDRWQLQSALRNGYFEGHGRDPAMRDDNSNKMAMNCLLSLKAYRLIQVTSGGNEYAVTDLVRDLLSVEGDVDEFHRCFAVHILTNLEGLLLARLVENIHARGEQVTLEYLGEELNGLGIKIPPNSTYISTMRSWLAQAGAFHSTGYKVNWDVIYSLLGVDEDFIDKLYELTPEQKYYLLSLVSLDVRDFIPSNKVAKHTRDVYKVRLTSKNLVKDVLDPLTSTGLVETRKTTTGRGAKPHEVRLTEKGINEILRPLIDSLANVTNLTSSELNRTFESVVADLAVNDKHVRGKALELFAVWIVRLVGLRFLSWRLRHFQSTGGGEVDVMAASDKIVYSRWQIQCKNQKTKVGVDVIAKEVGLTFVTKADVVMVVTSSDFASDAVNYADRVTDNSRYYVILLNGEDVQRIVEDRSLIVDILNIKARRVFARKELGFSELGENLMENEYETEEDLENAIQEDDPQLTIEGV